MPTIWLICVLLASGIGAQQGHGPTESEQSSTGRLTEIRASGSRRFQSPELVRATGLAVGQQITDRALQAGADRLASTGMFTDVTYSFVTAPEGTRVEYKVNDTEKLLPAHFDNFVWLSTPELIVQLQNMEPLFRGELPNAGDMYQRLAADIKTILANLKVNAEVTVFPEVPQRGGAVFGFLYKVEGAKLPVSSIEFAGASTVLNVVLQKVAQSALLGQNYSQSAVRSIAALDFLPQYHIRGFLRASFGIPGATLRDRVTGDVAVTLPVSEGFSYDLAAVRWSGNTVFPAGELAKALKVQFGKPANQVQLEDDLGGISKIYGTRGHIEAGLQPRFTFDDAARTVTVDVEVHEGNQYRTGDLRFEGLSDKAVDSLRKLWRLRPGDVYDTSYPGLFVATAARQFDFSHLSVQIRQEPIRDSKIVNTTLSFAPK